MTQDRKLAHWIMIRSILLLSVCLGLSSCGDDGVPNPMPSPPDASGDALAREDASPSGPRVELGTGTTRFETIADDGAQELPLVLGPQGGWHIHASVRLHEIDVDRCSLLYELRNESGEVVNYPAEIILSERRMVREGNHWLRSGDFVILDITMPSAAVGQTMTLEATARPNSGASYRASRMITIGEVVDGTSGPAPG